MRIVSLAALMLAATLTHARAETLLTLTPRPGATMRVLTDKPAAPIGSVILLAGDNGVLDLDAQGGIHSGLAQNFLVRTRAAYVAAGYAVFVPDIASDLKGTQSYRFGKPHADDLALVVAEARKVAPKVAVIGTSRGAISAVDVFVKASGAAADALVISSGVLLDHNKSGSATTVGGIEKVRVPVLLMRHAQDFCKSTPPADADKFKAMLTGAPRVDIVTINGGGPSSAGADPCGASHYHGFYGSEGQANGATFQWLKENLR